MMSFRTLLAAAATTLLLSPALPPVLSPAQAEDHPEGIHVHDAYARSMGGIGASGAVFFTIHNNTATDERIVAARADVAAKIELHTHIMDAEGVMRMVEIEGGIALPAGGMHLLERGADHVMLMGLTVELKDGDIVPVTLVMESGTEVAFEAVIDNARMPDQGKGMMHGKPEDAGMGHGHGDGHGHGHGSGG